MTTTTSSSLLTHNINLIDEINKISLDHISVLFDTYMKNTKSGLLGMAEKANNNAKQSKLFEAQILIKQHAQEIKQQSFDALKTTRGVSKTATTGVKDKPGTTSHENLELIDLAEFEDWLSLEIIIRRANERYYRPQLYLTRRYCELFNQEFSREQLPISVDNLCQTQKQIFKHYELDPELLPVVYRFFDESVISQLDSLYQMLNDTFKRYGILPNLESQPIQKHHQQNTPNEQTLTPQNTSTPVASRLMDVVTHFQHLIQSSDTESISANKQATIPPNDLIKQLSQLQNDVQTIDALVDNESLQQLLLSKNNLALPAESLDLINLVESIFNTIDAYPSISNALLTAIKRLQVPIAKAALLDPNFFTYENHPARVLLNQMIELSLNSEIPNNSLENQFNTIAANINTNFDQDNSIFHQASTTLAVTAEQQAKTYSRNTKRIVQTYEGKQQLKRAIDTISDEINQRIKPPKAPQVIVDLLENGWSELLKLTYLKLGPDNKAWFENLDIIDQLLQWINDFGDENAREKNSHRKIEADAFVDLIEQKLNSAFPSDYRYSNTIDQIRDTINGIRAVKLVDVAPVTDKRDQLAQELLLSKPEIGRWIKLAEKVKISDEFSYLNDTSGKKNIKLVWISNNKQHFVFVNNRGQKTLDIDLFDLAHELSKDLIPVEKNSELPLVERSLYSTIEQAYETLAFRSSHDELTTLLNRKECEKLLGQAIADARKHSHYHCLLYIDIDQFSLVNNLHGHVAGDKQLVEISKLIQKHLPNNAIAARMAGNEFVILLKNQDEQQHLKVCEDLRAEIEKHPFIWQDHTIQLTTSIGLVVINQFTENVIDLVRNAVEACQIAKQNGGNRFYDFRQDSELHTRREKLLSWIDKLDHLLSSDKLVLRAQAITPTDISNKEIHFEILLALKDDKQNLISPSEFIEAAESYGRMQKVDRWVIDKAFQWLQSVELGPQKTPSISINLSGNSLNDDSFADFLLEKFEKYQIPAHKICFEVTETATINNIAEVAEFIREIKNIGCEFSLDDFGSGNASYQYLRHLPVDYIKIDGMFVQEIDKNPDDFSLVKSINDIAHLMGKKSVAEYAESLAIIEKLKEIGVDYLQGYAISKPQLLNKIVLERQIH